jgi:hypothetical protein
LRRRCGGAHPAQSHFRFPEGWRSRRQSKLKPATARIERPAGTDRGDQPRSRGGDGLFPGSLYVSDT